MELVSISMSRDKRVIEKTEQGKQKKTKIKICPQFRELYLANRLSFAMLP